jgi:hypothetical protein
MKKILVKGIINDVVPELKTRILRGKSIDRTDVYVGAKSTAITCEVEETNGQRLAKAKAAEGTVYGIDHFNFDVLSSFRHLDRSERHREASMICTPEGNKIPNKNMYETNDGWRFSNLGFFFEVAALCCMDKTTRKPVTEFIVSEVRFGKRDKTSIEILEKTIKIPMPLQLRSMYTVFASGEPDPSREQIATRLGQYIGGLNLEEEQKQMLLNLTDALACVFLNAFGYDEFLKEESSLQTQLAPVAEIKSAAPATESKPENETPAPVSEDTEETEPEATAMAAVGGGEPAVMRDPDPDNVARTQAELGSETKKTSTRRHGSKTGGPKKGK